MLHIAGKRGAWRMRSGRQARSPGRVVARQCRARTRRIDPVLLQQLPHHPGIGSAKNLSGPPLHDLARRAYLGGNLPNTPSNLIRWITDPQGIVPATTMPDLGVTDAEARDMAAYLFGRST